MSELRNALAMIVARANMAGGPRLSVDSDVDALLEWVRWNNGGGQLPYEEDKEPKPELIDMWCEIESVTK